MLVSPSALIAAVCAMTTPTDPPATAYLSADGKGLKCQLVLREEQGGFAGTSVNEWRVEPNGKWTLAKFLVVAGGTEQPDTRVTNSGTLKLADLTKLTDRLAAEKFLDLPAELGKPAKVNPHNYKLTFGTKVVSLSGAPPRYGEPLKPNIVAAIPETDPTAAAVKRLATVIAVLTEVTSVEVK